MGMFDTVICEHPLPVKWEEGSVFQTKSLNNTLSCYKIDNQGHLWKKIYRKSDTFEACPHTGEIMFHDFGTDGDLENVWIEFCATFSQGRLTDIKLVAHERYNRDTHEYESITQE